jgi:hypothetical protein
MSGKGLSFLHKKPFHPQRTDNIEKKWLAEQKKASEEHNVELLRKERAEDRQEEVRKLQETASGRKSAPRVNWMYEMPMSTQHLPVEARVEETEVKQIGSTPGASFPRNGPTPENKRFAILNEDPLVAIRRNEQAAIQNVLSNPVKMRAIWQQAEAMGRATRPTAVAPEFGSSSSSSDEGGVRAHKRHRSELKSGKRDKGGRRHKADKRHTGERSEMGDTDKPDKRRHHKSDLTDRHDRQERKRDKCERHSPQ